MATITPVSPTVAGVAVVGVLPTTADQIPCSQYNFVLLVIRTGGTNTYAGTVDDPTTPAPAGTTGWTATTPDASTGTVAISSVKAMCLDCARFRDANGNINITSSSTFTGTTLEAYGF